MKHAPLIEKPHYLLSVIPRHFSKEAIAENGKFARKVAFEKKKPLVLDFRQADLQFDHKDVIRFFDHYYQKPDQLLKMVYVAHWFPTNSIYLEEIRKEWFEKGISTHPFSTARDIIHWVQDINRLKALG